MKVGATDGTRTAITSGLAVGDQVVVDGADRLRDGAKVTIPARTMPAPADQPATAALGQGGHRRHPAAGAAAGSP